MSNHPSRTLFISASAIIFSALIGTALFMTGATLAGALGITLMPHLSSPSNGMLVCIGIVVSLALTTTFFIAGYIASRVAHQQFIFDSMVHSLSAWAIMAVILITTLVFANLAESARRNLSGLKTPALVTDVEVFEGKAVTSIESLKKGSKVQNRQEKRAENEGDRMLVLMWWIVFSSLALGAASAIAGGLVGRKKQQSTKVG